MRERWLSRGAHVVWWGALLFGRRVCVLRCQRGVHAAYLCVALFFWLSVCFEGF
jgi:hypothetical protein